VSAPIAAELRQHEEIGDRTIDRAIRAVQRHFCQPPDFTAEARHSKYR